MKTDKKTKKEVKLDPVLAAQLNTIAAEAKGIGLMIDAERAETKAKVDQTMAEIKQGVSNVEQIYSDLDNLEKETGDKLDKLVLTQAEELASDE